MSKNSLVDGKTPHTLELVTRIGTRIGTSIMRIRIQWGNMCKRNSKYTCVELSNMAKTGRRCCPMNSRNTALGMSPPQKGQILLVYLSLGFAFPLSLLTLSHSPISIYNRTHACLLHLSLPNHDSFFQRFTK